MYYFTDDYLIGVEQIDEEHKEFFRLIGEIRDLLADDSMTDKRDTVYDMVTQLDNSAKEHFKHEEEYMEQIGHSGLKLQREQHLEFSAKIGEIKGEIDGRDPQELLNDLFKYLVRWIYRHIIGSDLMIGKMTPFEEWKKSTYGFMDEYLTGIEIIDEEHKELFRVIRKIHNILVNYRMSDRFDEIAGLLEELMIFTKAHFKDEEEYMASIRYKGLESQRAEHEKFIARIEEMGLNGIRADQEVVLGGIMAFFTKWLINHILSMDKKIG